jgi:hypothetical protein
VLGCNFADYFWNPLLKNYGLKLAFLLAIAAAIIAESPNWYGSAQELPHIIFLWSGFPWDSNQYLAFMRVGFRGDFFLSNLLSSEPHTPVLLMPFFVALGHVARWYHGFVRLVTGESLEPWQALLTTYHDARVVLTFLLALSFYRLTGSFTTSQRRRLWITLYALFANGILWGQIFATESTTLSSCIIFPNFSFSLLCYVWLLDAFWRALRTEHGINLNVVIVAVAGFCLAYVHPFDLPAVGMVGVFALVGWWLKTKKVAWRLLAVFGAFCVTGGAAVLLQKMIAWQVPEFGKIDSGNVMMWKAWWNPLAALELYLVVALAGLPFLWRRRKQISGLFVLAWFAAAFFVMYLPLPFQRRTIEGVPFVLAFMAATAAEGWGEKIYKAYKPHKSCRTYRLFALALVFAFLLPKTVWVLYDRSVATYGKPNDYYYAHVLEMQAMVWLEDQGDWQDVVWASRWTGNRVPFVSGHRAYLAHGVMTVESERKEVETQALFSRQMPIVDFRRILHDNGIRYILWTEKDRQADAGQRRDFDSYDPETLGKPVFQNAFARVYRCK